MFKEITFSSHIERGGKTHRVIYPVYPGRDNALIKCANASELHPELRDFISRLKPDPAFAYVVMVALGAGESWSSNVNGDWFGRHDLVTKHPTFVRNSKVYHLHDNKKDSPAYGSVLFSRFNPVMDRVELVTEVSRAGLPEVIEALDRNELVDVSMGTKVDHDVCSICGNKAKRFAEYCQHLKYEMNKIYPDGRKVYADNPDPDFFDISFVDSGADRTAKVLAKVAAASGSRQVMHSVLLAEKFSSEKDAEMDKGVSMVEKALPDKLKQYWLTLGQRLESPEKIDLRCLNSDVPLNDALGLATKNDVLLKPNEFFSFIINRLFNDTRRNFLSDHIFNEGLTLSDDEDNFTELPALNLTGSLPLDLPNLFSVNRKLGPSSVTMRMRFIAGDGEKLAGSSTFSKVSINKQVDQTLCNMYRNYVKQASGSILNSMTADTGLKLLTSLLATVVIGKAFLEEAPPDPIFFGSSDVMGLSLPETLSLSNITESELKSEITRQTNQLEKLRRSAQVPLIMDPFTKAASLVRTPSQVLASAAHYLEACGTKTARIGKMLTDASPAGAAVFLALGNNLSV